MRSAVTGEARPWVQKSVAHIAKLKKANAKELFSKFCQMYTAEFSVQKYNF